MKLFDEIRSLIKAIVVTKHELASIRESLSKLEGQFDRNETSLIDVRERVARLEALQDAHPRPHRGGFDPVPSRDRTRRNPSHSSAAGAAEGQEVNLIMRRKGDQVGRPFRSSG